MIIINASDYFVIFAIWSTALCYIRCALENDGYPRPFKFIQDYLDFFKVVVRTHWRKNVAIISSGALYQSLDLLGASSCIDPMRIRLDESIINVVNILTKKNYSVMVVEYGD